MFDDDIYVQVGDGFEMATKYPPCVKDKSLFGRQSMVVILKKCTHGCCLCA